MIHKANEFLSKNVTFRAVLLTYVAGLIAIALGAASVQGVDNEGKRADKEIFLSRNQAVNGACKAQNTSRETLSRLIVVSLSGPNDSDIPNSQQRAFRISFLEELRKLQPFDCKTQQEILADAAEREAYETFVPYCVTYKGYNNGRVGKRNCPPPPELSKTLKESLLTGVTSSNTR